MAGVWVLRAGTVLLSVSFMAPSELIIGEDAVFKRLHYFVRLFPIRLNVEV